MGKTQAEEPRRDSERTPRPTPETSVHVPSSQQAFLALGTVVGNRALGRLIDNGRLQLDRDPEPTTNSVDTAEQAAEVAQPELGLHVNPGAQPEGGDEKSTTATGDEAEKGIIETLLSLVGAEKPADDWRRPLDEVKERNKGWMAAKMDHSNYISLPFSESWATNATDASVTNALLTHLFEGKERGPRTFERLRNSLDIRSYGGSVAGLGDDQALRANFRAILSADPTATTFKYQIKPGTLGVIEEAYRRLRVFEVRRGREMYEAAAEETGQMVFDFYRAHANGVIRLANGAVSLTAENYRRMGLIDEVPQIPELKMQSQWGKDNKRTLEIGVDLGLLLVGGALAASTKAAAAGVSLEVRAVTVGGLNVGRWLDVAVKAWFTVGGVSSVETVAKQSRDAIELLFYDEVYDPETGISRPPTADERLDAWKQLFDISSGGVKDAIVNRKAKQNARREAEAAPPLDDPGTVSRDRADDAPETTTDVEGEATTPPRREPTDTADAPLADASLVDGGPTRSRIADTAVENGPASQPTPDGPSNVSGQAKGKGKGKDKGGRHRMTEVETRIATLDEVLVTTKNINKVRKKIDDGEYGKTAEQKNQVLKEFEVARLNQIEMTEGAVAQQLLEGPTTRVRDGKRSYVDGTLEVRFDDVGSKGFLSDRDRMVTVEYSDPELSRLAKEYPEAAATLVKKSIEVVIATDKKLGERVQGSADTALDTNYYTDLHEERFVPNTPDERSAISIDQDVAALTVQRMHMPEHVWGEHARKLVEGLDDATSKKLQDKIDQATVRAEALEQKTLPMAYAELTQALSKRPLDMVEVRRLQTDVKLLEPDAYGARAAVLEIRASQELSTLAGDSTTKSKTDGTDADNRSPVESDYPTPRREQVAAAAANVTRGKDAHSIQVQSHRAAVENGFLAKKISRTGNTLEQVSAAAKHLQRILDSVENVGLVDPQIKRMAKTMGEVIRAKKIGKESGASVAHRAIDRWIRGATGPEVSWIDPTTTRQAAFDAFAKEASRLGSDASVRLTQLYETAPKEE